VSPARKACGALSDMPNWCDSDLCVIGSAAEVERFVNGLKFSEREGEGAEFSILDSYYPMPEELKSVISGHGPHAGDNGAWMCEVQEDGSNVERPFTPEEVKTLKEKYGCLSWYDWCVNHWDTKWSDSTTVVTTSATSVKMRMNTPWSPPLKGLLEVSKKFPKLKFRISYYERGMAYKGSMTFNDGLVLEETSGTYHGSRGG